MDVHRSVLKLPYLFYYTIIAGLAPIFSDDVHTDTTILVCAFAILISRVKIVIIHIVSLKFVIVLQGPLANKASCG